MLYSYSIVTGLGRFSKLHPFLTTLSKTSRIFLSFDISLIFDKTKTDYKRNIKILAKLFEAILENNFCHKKKKDILDF